MDISHDTARGMAAAVLSRPDASAQTLKGLIEVCRRAGALEAASQLLNRLPTDEIAASDYLTYLKNIFLLEFPPASPPNSPPVPTRFVLQRDFLPSEVHAGLLEAISASAERFSNSIVHSPNFVGVDVAARNSSTSFQTQTIEGLFLPFLRPILEILNRHQWLGYNDLKVDEIQRCQVSAYSNNGFFQPHRDVASGAYENRRVSFVYYCHFPPKRFLGGDLLIFDAKSDLEYSEDSYTRVLAEQNSIILFPARTVHQVSPVSTSSDDIFESRFSVHGWLI